MKLAYFLLVHKNPDQVDRLVDMIQDGQNYIAIHADRKSGPEFRRQIEAIAARYPNTRLTESRYCTWAGWSLVAAELDAIRVLLEMSPEWEFFINLSGQDCALQTQDEIRGYLSPRRGSNFMFIQELATWPNGMKRLKQYYFELPRGMFYRPLPTFIPRSFPSDLTPYGGSQWTILSREFCQYLVDDPQVTRLQKFFRHSIVPDEMFMQTAIMNSHLADTVVRDFRRYLPKFIGQNNPRPLGISDLPKMLDSGYMFARKFDPAYDNEVIDVLHRRAKGLE